ncbi:phosphonoacetaldehyde hydrolase [Oceanimonas sp. GK1]|uniref:phosphonoacetaldehyde hydrolase n=1 Tax=Oceanimonas sp. (strain GK1 / IBRC-M 10197) TaxID=511062 RepID=UPI0002494BD7|nr:phosphonoacetaldehyde hydrolase [Oceanimonas sp. GK1]AEY00029.1 phosphonoacetaldehyde hydrolase [Oceanimonas sp. GK1]
MSYRFERRYTGSVQAVIMDWAGTTVDFGSMAPIRAFQRLFAGEGIEVTLAECRAPMGSEKREHICRMLAMPRIGAAWIQGKGEAPSEADIDRLYQDFVQIQIECIRDSAVLIPGMAEVAAELTGRGIRLGANTGYSRDMIAELVQHAAEQGYAPEVVITASDVQRGRPWPEMSLRAACALEAGAMQACVKVDDTGVGIEEGLNAGMWTVALAVSGNEVGLSLEDWQALAPDEQQRLCSQAHARLAGTGAHYVIDTIAELPGVIDDINGRLARGERP